VGLAQSKSGNQPQHKPQHQHQRISRFRAAAGGGKTAAAAVRSLPLTWSVCCFAFATTFEVGKVVASLGRELGEGVLKGTLGLDDDDGFEEEFLRGFVLLTDDKEKRKQAPPNSSKEKRREFASYDLAMSVFDSGVGGGFAGLVASRIPLPSNLRVRGAGLLMRYGVMFGMLGGAVNYGIFAANNFLSLGGGENKYEDLDEDEDERAVAANAAEAAKKRVDVIVTRSNERELESASEHYGRIGSEIKEYLQQQEQEQEQEPAKKKNGDNLKKKRWWQFW